MEKFDMENEIQKRKASYQIGIGGHSQGCDANRTAKAYTESIRLFKQFLQGEINAQELERMLREFDEMEVDLFEEEENGT